MERWKGEPNQEWSQGPGLGQEATVSSLSTTPFSEPNMAEAQEISVDCERGDLEKAQLGPRVRVSFGALCE